MPETPTVPDGRPIIHPPGGASDSPTVPSVPPDQEPVPAAEPRAFGRFELLEELGSGGMGTVYKARQLDLGRIVALKALHGSLGASQSLIERFLREARAAANLDHPGLVRVFEVGCLEGTYFFTMEYVRGESLLDKVSRGPVPLAERIRWVRDAALAVHHAHLEGLVHRDIKPQNILLDTEGRVKVADFGLVREVSEGRGLTLTGGLPYFGGPGNSYSLHGIAETVVQMRDRPGNFGFVGANGGIMSKYSVGIYSTEPAPWRPSRSAELTAQVAALPRAVVNKSPEGTGTIETYSVRYDWPVRTGIIVGRLDADDSRFMATTQDAELVALMSQGDPLGAKVSVTPTESGNRAVLG